LCNKKKRELRERIERVWWGGEKDEKRDGCEKTLFVPFLGVVMEGCMEGLNYPLFNLKPS